VHSLSLQFYQYVVSFARNGLVKAVYAGYARCMNLCHFLSNTGMFSRMFERFSSSGYGNVARFVNNGCVVRLGPSRYRSTLDDTGIATD
jgi:hypothetical protein